MRRFYFAAPLLLSAFGVLTMAHAAPPMPASDSEDVSECILLNQEDVPAGIAFSFNNTCDTPVRCDFSWALRCDADEATGAEARLTSYHFSLQAGHSRTYIADTAACGDDGWSLGEDIWNCIEH